MSNHIISALLCHLKETIQIQLGVFSISKDNKRFDSKGKQKSLNRTPADVAAPDKSHKSAVIFVTVISSALLLHTVTVRFRKCIDFIEIFNILQDWSPIYFACFNGC